MSKVMLSVPLYGPTETGRDYGRARWLEQHVYNTFYTATELCIQPWVFWCRKIVWNLNATAFSESHIETIIGL